MSISWKSHFSFGKYSESEADDGERRTLIWVLINDKPYLRWCFREGLDKSFDEIRFIKQNIKPAELKAIMHS